MKTQINNKVQLAIGDNSMDSPEHCFVIMPFSVTTKDHTEKYWTHHFECFLKPSIENCGDFEVVRSEPLMRDIIREIIENLVNSPLVVAELTDYNPNVFWELGVRQSYKYGTITVAEEGTRLPFNIYSKGTLFYDDNKTLTENKQYQDDLRKAVENWLNNKALSDSRVLETTGRLKYEESKKELLHHSTLVSDYVTRVERAIDTPESVRIIRREIKTIKYYLTQICPLVNRYGKEKIDDLSARADELSEWSIQQIVLYHNKIGCWASQVHDPVLSYRINPF